MTRFQITLWGRIERVLLFFHTDQLWMSVSWSAYRRSPERRCRAPGPAQFPTPCLWDWIPAACSGLPQSSESHPCLKDGCLRHHTLPLALKVKNENNWFTWWKQPWRCKNPTLRRYFQMFVIFLLRSRLQRKTDRWNKRHNAFKILCMVPILLDYLFILPLILWHTEIFFYFAWHHFMVQFYVSGQKVSTQQEHDDSEKLTPIAPEREHQFMLKDNDHFIICAVIKDQAVSLMFFSLSWSNQIMFRIIWILFGNKIKIGEMISQLLTFPETVELSKFCSGFIER